MYLEGIKQEANTLLDKVKEYPDVVWRQDWIPSNIQYITDNLLSIVQIQRIAIW